MDVREKLVELANDILRYLPWGEIQKDTAERIADRMMDHGVTVQEWISVTERLPECEWGAENADPVLYMMKSTKTIYAGYYGEGGTWRDKYFRQYADRHEGVDADGVLCWIYQKDLPQPPKGE